MADTLQIWTQKGHRSWSDGDPMELYRQCRILRANAWVIIRDQYGKHLALLEPYKAATCRWKYERISATEWRRTDLLTDEVTRQTNPNMEEYLAGVRARGSTPIFGTIGSEVIYDGGVPLDDDGASSIWDALEARTTHRRTDHLDLQAGSGDLRDTLLLEIAPVTRAERESILEPGTTTKRKRKVEWEKLAGMDVAKIAAVRDPAQTVDLRKTLARVEKTAVVVRAEVIS